MIRVLKILVIILLSSLALSVSGQIYIKPNNSYGTIQNRSRDDSTKLIPTFCGAPVGKASLHSIDQKMSALYYDSCGRRFYVYSPSDSSWAKMGATQLNDSSFKVGNDTITIRGTGGGGGGSADSATFSTNYRRDTAIANVRTQLAGKQATGNYITATTGDVTSTGPGSVAATIANNVVTNAKAAQMAAHTFKGNNTGSTANGSDLTATQLTAELNVFGASLKGLVPAAAASPSSTKYLSEDGTFTTPAGGSATTVASRRDTLLYNDGSEHVIEVAEKFVGPIYNKYTWANLNDFIQVGGTNFTISGDSIQGSGGTGNFSHTLNLNTGAHDTTCLQKWKMSGNFRPKSTKASNTYGFGLGIRSTNVGHGYNALVQFDATNTGTSGKILIYGGVDSSVIATSTSALSFSVGDEINITIEQYDNVLTASARNVTTNSTTITCNYIYDFQTGAVMHNSGQFAVFSFGGNFTIRRFAIESAEVKNANVLVLTDSKGAGYSAGSFSESWANLLSGRYKTVVNLSGGSDATTQLISRVAEVIALKPKQVLFQIPSNDIRYGVSDPTSHANYSSMATQFRNAGIAVYYVTPIYETSVDLSSQYTYLYSTFSTDSIIDVWSPTNIAGTVYSDGVHPNTFGHQKTFEAIVSSNKLFGAHVPVQMTGANGYVPKFIGSTGFGISHLSDDDTYINSTLSHNIKNIMPQLFLTQTDAGTDGKIWGIRTNGGDFDINIHNDAYDQPGATALRINRTGTTINYTESLVPFGVLTAPTSGYIMHVLGKTFIQTSSGTQALTLRMATDDNFEFFNYSGENYMYAISNDRSAGKAMALVATTWRVKNNSLTTVFGTSTSNNVLINTETDNATGARLQVNGKVSIATIDSTSTAANMLYQDPATGLIKKAAVPSSGGITSINSQTGSSQTIAAGNDIDVTTTTNTVTVSKKIADQVHTSGTSVTISNNVTRLFIDPSSALASLAITFPSTPFDGQVIKIFFGGTSIQSGASDVVTGGISSWSAGGNGTVPIAPISPTPVKAGTVLIFEYKASSTLWYQIQ